MTPRDTARTGGWTETPRQGEFPVRPVVLARLSSLDARAGRARPRPRTTCEAEIMCAAPSATRHLFSHTRAAARRDPWSWLVRVFSLSAAHRLHTNTTETRRFLDTLLPT